MAVQTLYKYRSLADWAPILDIVVNGRLYAAPFESLNDPMEGRYYYFGEDVSSSLRKALHQSKRRRNICSLSAARNNTLLWSYYAAGHTGIAFGVQIKAPSGASVQVQQVRYDSGVYIGAKEAKQAPDKLALNVLTQKQLPWAHEREVRVFSPSAYVPVRLVEILLGCNISQRDADLVATVARKWHPKIKITQVERSSLDNPDALRGDKGQTPRA